MVEEGKETSKAGSEGKGRKKKQDSGREKRKDESTAVILNQFHLLEAKVS